MNDRKSVATKQWQPRVKLQKPSRGVKKLLKRGISDRSFENGGIRAFSGGEVSDEEDFNGIVNYLKMSPPILRSSLKVL